MADTKPPRLCKEAVVELISTSFPFKRVDINSVRQLDSYYDGNYYFQGTLQPCEASRVPISESGEYILKIWNSTEGQARCEGRSLIMKHLLECSDNIPCPRPVRCRCKKGNFVDCVTESAFQAKREENMVEGDPTTRCFPLTVLEYLPGRVMEEVDPPPYLLFEAGQVIGSIARNLQSFINGEPDVEVLTAPATAWNIKNVSLLKQYLHAVEDPKRKDITNNVISAFERNVVPKLSSGLLRCGLVHGDGNGMNLLVQSVDGILKLSGIIDFGHIRKTFYVFEVAVYIAYMMILKYKHNSIQDPLELAQLLSPAVSGFLHAFPLNSEELDCLYYSVLGRLCQSGVLGLHMYMETKDEYALSTHCLTAWKVVEMMLKTSKEEVNKIWLKDNLAA